MGVADFLKTLQHRGISLADPRVADVTTGSFLTRNAPFVFANLLQSASRPGGFLSALGQDRVFSGQADAAVSEERTRLAEGQRALQQSGLSANMAERILGEDELRTQRRLSELKGQSEAQLQSREFEAGAELAKVLGSSEATEKASRQTESQFQRTKAILREGQHLQRWGTYIAALGAVSSLFGEGGFFGALGSLGAKIGSGAGDGAAISEAAGAALTSPSATTGADITTPLGHTEFQQLHGAPQTPFQNLHSPQGTIPFGGNLTGGPAVQGGSANSILPQGGGFADTNSPFSPNQFNPFGTSTGSTLFQNTPELQGLFGGGGSGDSSTDIFKFLQSLNQ